MVSVRQVNISILMPNDEELDELLGQIIPQLTSTSTCSFRIESPKAQEMPEQPIPQKPEEITKHER